MAKLFFRFFIAIVILYVILCVALYFLQEKLIYFPHTLNKDYSYNFSQEFEELNFKTADGILLNGLWFKVDNPKGLLFYLHGNAGDLSSWGDVAQTYRALNYDVLMIDYRGFGKSGGKIYSQQQLFSDNQMVYDSIRQHYDEMNIVILGYSIGSGLAAKLASDNKPKQLILQAPYYSLIDMMQQRFSFIPTFLLKYKFETNHYLKKCKMPITLFHGDQDEVIDYTASLRLKEELKSSVNLFILKGQRHNGMTDNFEYQKELVNILE